ncbi:MAG: hypothetical protein Greene101449_1096 [Candidatus Peregrinibacteria bacterium Greene1014_49]|nr:MAG: hypothetical protein Greene101449_1096 [Candidatus Peregrinibacteria bacterium Greene1014_49]
MISKLFASFLTAQTYTASPTGAGTVTGLAKWNVDSAAHQFDTMYTNIIKVLMSSIVNICIAVFITGALLYVIGSFGKEDLKSNGKNMMIGALIGLLIVQLGRAIVHVTLLFLYNGF